MALETVEQGAGKSYKVAIRTTTKRHSAEILGGLMGGPIAHIGNKAVDELWAWVKHRHQTEQSRNVLCSRLFREMQNADFVLGARFPKERGLWADADITASCAMLKGCPGLFADVTTPNDIVVDASRRQTLRPDEPIDRRRNHIFFCAMNPFVFWFMGLTEEVPFAGLSKRRRDKIREQLAYQFSILEDEWCITKGKEQVYRPVYNATMEVYDRDYLMVLKIPSMFEEARANTDFIVAGCHGAATEGIGLMLEDESILKRVEEEIGSAPYFQIIVEVDIGVRRESTYQNMRRNLAGLLRYKKYEFEKIVEPDTVKYIDAVPLSGL